MSGAVPDPTVSSTQDRRGRNGPFLTRQRLDDRGSLSSDKHGKERPGTPIKRDGTNQKIIAKCKERTMVKDPPSSSNDSPFFLANRIATDRTLQRPDQVTASFRVNSASK